MKNKYFPFDADEILEVKRDGIIVQNSATQDHLRLDFQDYRGVQYLIATDKVSVVEYALGIRTLKQFMKDSRVYRIVKEDCLRGLGKKLVIIEDEEKIQKVLDKSSRAIRKGKKDLEDI